MAIKKRLYIDKPFINASGSYTFLSNNNSNEYNNSDSIPNRFDKFQRKDLYTLSSGHDINEKIINSYYDELNQSNYFERLKYNSPSHVTIDSMFIDWNSYELTGKVDDTKFFGHIVSERSLNMNNKSADPDSHYGDVLSPIKNADGTFKDFESLRQIIFYQNDGVGPALDGENRTMDEVGEFFQENPDVLNPAEPPPGRVLENATILKYLNNGVTRQDADTPDLLHNSYASSGPTPQVAVFGNEGDTDHFRPKQIFWTGDNPSSTFTKIFDEGPDAVNNPIYFIFYLKGNKKGGSNRKKRIQIYEINPLELFQRDDAGVITGGKITKLELGEGIIIDQDENTLIPAFKITEFNVTINTQDGASEGYLPNPVYGNITSSILPSQTNFPLSINDIDSNILNIHPERELKFSPSEGELFLTDGTPNEFTDFLPVSNATIKGRPQEDLQVYYQSDYLRQIVSAPTTVELDFTITNSTGDKGELIDRNILYNNDYSNYMFTVVSWNDVNDEIKTVKNVIDGFPETFIELNNRRKENLFHFRNLGNPLFNDYKTPGIKNIKSLLFNYYTDANGLIEPIRFKLVTTRIFLDIPVSQFPDFGEVGGADYTTIPWPYTTPIVGGVSKDSKYLKSVNDTLGGGKIGDLDIIDEVFLVEAQENDELGENIQKFDLEQVRFFNKSYDMNNLLNIPITTLPINCQEIIFSFSPDQYQNGDFQVFDETTYPNLMPENYGGYNTPSEWICNNINLMTTFANGIDPSGNNVLDYNWNWYVKCNTGDIIPLENAGQTPDHLSQEADGGGWLFSSGQQACESLNSEPVETYINPYTSNIWDGDLNKFSEESSVGQIFINDNQDTDLIKNCKLELNTGNLSGKSIDDSNGHGNKGLLIGDYRIKKTQKNRPMRRDSFIKVPKKNSNKDGAM